MNPFVAKPGETINGLGFDFCNRLSKGENILLSSVVADSGLTVGIISNQGTIVTATIAIPDSQPDTDLNVNFTVTGTAGSVRKGTRIIWVRAISE